MTEAKAHAETFTPSEEDRDFMGVIKALAGKKVMVVNPESYEAAPMVGFQLKENFYPGKVAGWGSNYVILHTVVTLPKKEGGQQPVQQFIPIARIKRISALKTGVYLHL